MFFPQKEMTDGLVRGCPSIKFMYWRVQGFQGNHISHKNYGEKGIECSQTRTTRNRPNLFVITGVRYNREEFFAHFKP